MGKGDKRTKRGKINTGSFGNSRKKVTAAAKPVAKKAAPKATGTKSAAIKRKKAA